MYKYLANTNTKEIHKIANITENCEISKIRPEHKRYLQYDSEMRYLIDNYGYNGCYWCFREEHTN